MESARDFIAGIRAAVPVIIAVLPFGLLFGAVAVDNGFAVFEAVLMSAIVYAGASQMVGIELFGQEIAPWLIVFSIFAVNFRHVLYSAALGRRVAGWSMPQRAIALFLLTDPQFAETERRSEQGKAVPFRWYIGMGTTLYLTWVGTSWIGAVFGKIALESRGMDVGFLLPIYFLGLVMSFRGRSLWAPVVAVSGLVSIVAHLLIGPPWHVSLGALAGVALAAAVANPSAPQELD